MLRGMPRDLSHAQRLEAFYAPQAAHYDAFRERLLHGRRELIGSLPLPDRAHVVELGGGTGRNLEFFGARASHVARYDVVDLCAPLLERARDRRRLFPQLHAIEADATTWRPCRPVDAVILSYALTMIPDWRAAVANAYAMLKPGGTLYISFPIGESAVHFNAHRVFAPTEVLGWAGDRLSLQRFDYVGDDGNLRLNQRPEALPPLQYGCGIYTFRKAG